LLFRRESQLDGLSLLVFAFVYFLFKNAPK